MAKQKSLTPQEIYKARKQREEQEKEALLPPGLYNHGNTCFMNSVLQGLISTQPLFDLVHSAPQSSTVTRPITLRRSPQLTNGHGLGGEYEQAWIEGMSLGDVFVRFMHKAWSLQQQRGRESMSPRQLLTALGCKYDQYLDFAQQDAHEFLRQLLDAMRMEELDVIKKRQPRSQQKKRRRKPPPLSSSSSILSTSSPLSASDTTSSPATPNPTASEDDKLCSFVDMLFGGRLTSILVCEKCKNVSQSYEDFNDLSLSIKPEDYARERKRHRLKMLAKKLTSFPGATLSVGTESTSMQRSSSVPPTPREENSFRGVDDVPIVDDPRRRSLDFAAELSPGRVGGAEQEDTNGSLGEACGPLSSPEVTKDDIVPEEIPIVSSDEPKQELKSEKEEKAKDDDKKKDDDGWVKFGRRISMRVGLGKVHKEQKDRKFRGRQSLKGDTVEEVPRAKESEEAVPFLSTLAMFAARTSTSDVAHDKGPKPEVRTSLSISSPIPKPVQGRAQAPLPVSVTSRSNLPTASTTNLSRFPHIQRPTSKRPKSPRPLKPTPQETAYLRQILADITPASSNPFAFLKPSSNGAPSSSTATAQTLWLKMGQLPGIEECLKMFTAVEILDGENMVGCRRCWKIANGVYEPRHAEEGSDSDEKENPDIDEVESSLNGTGINKSRLPVRQSSSAPSSPTPSAAMSQSSPILSIFTHRNLSDGCSISTLPTTLSSESASAGRPLPLELHDDTNSPASSPERGGNVYIGSPVPHMYSTPPESPILTARPSIPQNNSGWPEEHSLANLKPFAGFSIPVISTTAPESPMSTPVTARPLAHADAIDHLRPSAPFPAHPTSTHRRPKECDVDSADESSGAESETSASISLYDHSETSTGSLAVAEDQLPARQPRRRSSTRSKHVIMRPAYKRYLIATPPPILVIHLKRFQQMSKTPAISFSHGFKKLDDFVTFPEYLDLTPFLAPRKEDFGLGKGGDAKARSKVQLNERERCMYRLYAVVVHIGNMLGGHYVAYTALPGTPVAKASGPPSSSGLSARSEDPSTTKTASKPTRQWAYISDTVVRLATLEEVLKVKAYICMYEQI